jgi:outer membrane protein assembly factor BamD
MNLGVFMRFYRFGINLFFIFSLLLLVFALFGCYGKKVRLSEMTPEGQFEYAMKYFKRRDYYNAKMQFTIVVLNNPGHLIIGKAQFYLGESYYHLKEYIMAVGEYEKLIRSLPNSEYVDDAQYKIGMCYYNLAPGYGLDQEYTRKAIVQFQLFLEEYPLSDLKEQVETKLSECRERLAKKEFKTGELYRKMGYFRAAIISFDAVLENYYDTAYSDDALYWKGESYRRLREWALAEEAFHTLLEKYPQSSLVMKTKIKLEMVNGRIDQEEANSEGLN